MEDIAGREEKYNFVEDERSREFWCQPSCLCGFSVESTTGEHPEAGYAAEGDCRHRPDQEEPEILH